MAKALPQTPNVEDQVSVFMFPSDRVAQLHVYSQVPGSRFFAYYDPQGCDGGILTSLHTRKIPR
jgi:hypothetical protein